MLTSRVLNNRESETPKQLVKCRVTVKHHHHHPLRRDGQEQLQAAPAPPGVRVPRLGSG